MGRGKVIVATPQGQPDATESTDVKNVKFHTPPGVALAVSNERLPCEVIEVNGEPRLLFDVDSEIALLYKVAFDRGIFVLLEV